MSQGTVAVYKEAIYLIVFRVARAYVLHLIVASIHYDLIRSRGHFLHTVPSYPDDTSHILEFTGLTWSRRSLLGHCF
jgi:hypothetical protein